jgi:hypothetical protein
VIDAHVFPYVQGLEVFTVPYAKGELLTISIPPQSEDYKPFLVHGNLREITSHKLKGCSYQLYSDVATGLAILAVQLCTVS